MGNKEPFYIKVLADELQRRKTVNSRYSLRAFASHMHVDPTYLSKCLACKQAMSFEIAEKAISCLNLDAGGRVEFLRSIAEQQSCMNLHKHDPSASGCQD